MPRKNPNTFFCFSPPVMLMTFLIELILAIYVLVRYKKSPVIIITVSILFLLAIFQLAEYMICGGLGLSNIEWAKVGYMAISLLPALGIHLILALANHKIPALLIAAYASAASYVMYFAVASQSVIARDCAPNYALFDTQGYGAFLYALYYYGWLFVAVILAAHMARKHPKKARVMKWMVIGYSSFIVPTTLANLINPSTMSAIPSIMCGFAVILAVVLVWRVLPLSGEKVIKR
jgi:hypothetical protein